VTRTWEYSKIAWGTPLRVVTANGLRVLMYRTDLVHPRWRRVQDVVPDATIARLQALYADLYGDSHIYDSDRDNVPDRWVFNDFGPFAVRYFRDRNRDGRLDNGETLSGEMIHTTPQDEAQTAKGQRPLLGESHGCIHVSPRGRDKLMRAGAFQRGIELVIHEYAEGLPPGWRP
jgi:hypothetical protein